MIIVTAKIMAYKFVFQVLHTWNQKMESEDNAL